MTEWRIEETKTPVSKKEGILIFDLEGYQNEFNIAVKSMDYIGTLWDLDQELRSKIKYFDPDNNPNNIDPDTLQIARDMLWECMEDNNVTFDDYL